MLLSKPEPQHLCQLIRCLPHLRRKLFAKRVCVSRFNPIDLNIQWHRDSQHGCQLKNPSKGQVMLADQPPTAAAILQAQLADPTRVGVGQIETVNQNGPLEARHQIQQFKSSPLALSDRHLRGQLRTKDPGHPESHRVIPEQRIA
jgi:hypothetical protein